MKRYASIILRVLLLIVLYSVIATVVSSRVMPPAAARMFTAEQMSAAIAAMPLVNAIIVVMLSYLALRSRWHGWRLAGALYAIFFSIQGFLSWIELLAFPAVSSRMPPGMLNSTLVQAVLVGTVFAPLMVWVLGKTLPDPADAKLPRRLAMPRGEWLWKLAAAAVLYVVVYFTFGYYVAWRTPSLPEFYGGTDPGTLLGQLGNVARMTPWLFPFQLLRGLVWAGVGCIVIAMHKGRTGEAALATGLTLSLITSAGMLMPNPFFTPVVQRAHTIELLTSNLLYGILLCLLMTWKRRRAPMGQPQAAPAD